jgi:hypothetical protein
MSQSQIEDNSKILKFKEHVTIILQKKEKGEKRMKTKTITAMIAILLTTMLLTPIFAQAPGIGNGVGSTISYEHNSDAMWVEVYPGGSSSVTDTSTSPVGTLFNITVCLNMTENVFAYQVALLYNRTWLAAIKAGFTHPPTSMYMSGHTTSASYTIDISYLGNGSVLAAESCLSGDWIPGPASGTLIWIEFEIMKAPYKTTYFSKFDITTNYGPPLDHTWVENPSAVEIPITTYDGSLTYSWSPPTTKPFMGIEHDTGYGIFPPTPSSPDTWPLVWPNVPPNPLLHYVNTNGSGFNAFIYVKNIDPAWGMYSANFTLDWNCSVIYVYGGLLNVTVNPLWKTVVYETLSQSGQSGQLDLGVENYTGTIGATPNEILVATVNFTVILQSTIPPETSGYFDSSPLAFPPSNITIADPTEATIPTTAPENGTVIINALITLKLPNLYVSPAVTTIGPSPVIGTTITVSIDVASLTASWHCVAIQTRLQYDDTVLSLVSVTEGAFMTNPIWNTYGTFFYSINEIGGDLVYPFTHVLLLDLLYPNAHGVYDQSILPNTIESAPVDPTLATFTFQVLQQNCYDLPNIVTALNILPFWKPTDKTFIDWSGSYISSNPGVNGTVVIQSLNEVNRQIDLFGGPVNDGYAPLVALPTPYGYTGYGTYIQLPAPYGGQGPGTPMDIAFPQTQIYLNAYVTYNYWPVQEKDVGFEVEGPFIHVSNTGNFTLDYVPAASYQVWAKFTATTDPNGVASYTYRMPWPCDDPDAITGVWRITATVTIADQVVCDTMLFYYQRPVYIFKVTTDSYGYYHDQYVTVTVTYGTHSMLMYPALFSTVITDNLSVPIGMALYDTQVGGAQFCTWTNSSFQVTIWIPKWAFAGDGYVEESVFDKDPTIGGEAWEPQYTPAPQINIYPYDTPLEFVPTTALLTDDSALGYVPPGTTGYASTWYSYWPLDTDLSVEYGDVLALGAAAIGGFPAMAPGDIPLYNYVWYVNGTVVLSNPLVTISSLTLYAGVAPLVTVTYPATFNITCTASDKLGTTISSTLWIFLHYSGTPPGP